jgi:hypothetical protein
VKKAEETLQALRFGERCGMVTNTHRRVSVTNTEEALSAIDDTLEHCHAQMESLRARGKAHLPAFKSLQVFSHRMSTAPLPLRALCYRTARSCSHRSGERSRISRDEGTSRRRRRAGLNQQQRHIKKKQNNNNNNNRKIQWEVIPRAAPRAARQCRRRA